MGDAATRARMFLAIVTMGWAPLAVSMAGNCPDVERGSRDTTPVTFTVAHDGSGDFRTIQEAIDAVAPDHAGQAIIIVKNGLYPEKLQIRCSRLTILEGTGTAPGSSTRSSGRHGGSATGTATEGRPW